MIKLTSASVLVYPDFQQDFILETNTSIHGLGAVLSQFQTDTKLHPVAYASRALNDCEKGYGITELETLAVVCGISHFHFLYGHNVTIYTDHTAVKAVLEADHLTAKHARWWTRVYAQGLKRVTVLYRVGKETLMLMLSLGTPACQHLLLELLKMRYRWPVSQQT